MQTLQLPVQWRFSRWGSCYCLSLLLQILGEHSSSLTEQNIVNDFLLLIQLSLMKFGDFIW